MPFPLRSTTPPRYAQLLLVKDRMRNFFRVPCDASEHATHVSIALPPGAAPQLPPDPLRIVLLARRLAARLAPKGAGGTAARSKLPS